MLILLAIVIWTIVVFGLGVTIGIYGDDYSYRKWN